MSDETRIIEAADAALRSAKQLLSVAAAAARLEVHPETIRRWIRDGKIRYTRFPGGAFKLERADIENIRTTATNTHPQP